MVANSNRQVGWMAGFTFLSWLGMFVHNQVDLPQLTLISPENSVPTLVSILLFLGWWRLPFRRLTALTLLGWALVQLVGGSLSVIPFDFLPYYPAQTVLHYFMHVLYAAAQVPLIVALIRQLRLVNPNLSGASV